MESELERKLKLDSGSDEHYHFGELKLVKLSYPLGEHHIT